MGTATSEVLAATSFKNDRRCISGSLSASQMRQCLILQFTEFVRGLIQLGFPFRVGLLAFGDFENTCISA